MDTSPCAQLHGLLPATIHWMTGHRSDTDAAEVGCHLIWDLAIWARLNMIPWILLCNGSFVR
eukprot:2183825-Amphidinium_carterae.1